jgi:Uncharacterized protein conserved in bacteria (DUF2188)
VGREPRVQEDHEMPKQGDVHVVYETARKAWKVEVTGNKRHSGTHSSKSPAVDQGRKLAQRNKSELVVHKQDGKIGERRSYGHDPVPPRG